MEGTVIPNNGCIIEEHREWMDCHQLEGFISIKLNQHYDGLLYNLDCCQIIVKYRVFNPGSMEMFFHSPIYNGL